METNRVVVKKEKPDVHPIFSAESAETASSQYLILPSPPVPLSQAYESSIHSAMDMAMKTEISMSISDLLTMSFETDELLGKHQISNSNWTNSKVENTIDAIKAKYGNIDEYCIAKSGRVRKVLLVCICDVVKELREKKIEELEVASLDNYYEVVRDIEKLNINVQWLLQRLDEIRDAITSRDGVKGLSDEKNELTKKLEANRREMERLNDEIRICEGRVGWFNRSFGERTSKLGKFQNRPLTDGLI